MGRRQFLGATAAAGLMIMKPELVRGTAANSAVRLGVLGCGGRGTAVATGFVNDTGSRVVALADVFEDQLAKARKHFDDHQKAKGYAAIDAKQLFKGPKACEQIVASKEADFVLVTSPPYFHPEHLEAAVAAGKHVYLEKPVAVDVPGAQRVMRLGEKAKGKLSLAVGFQIRNATPFVELTKRIHGGALGKISSAQVYYYSGHINRPDWADASVPERRLRNWVWDRVLSGDIIVEQNIHVIDVTNWVLQGHPIKAAGAGGRNIRHDDGDCFDHFNVTYTYPDDVHVTFSSTQANKGWWDVCERFFGSKGVSEAHYEAPVAIYGDEPWDFFKGAAAKPSGEFSTAGTFSGALDDADPMKQKAFIESITSGNFLNQATQGAESALSAMLGRMAAYTGRVVTWDEMLSSNESWDAHLDLEKMA
ncbi:MAG: Gfo/Idh/MocA family oxidoreductase [Acidobacteria bacterium]|nr:Gfo/Idh/MocA family oxidoreductase [Acidobacteriota bacterium]